MAELSDFMARLLDEIDQTQDLDHVLQWILNRAKERLHARRGDVAMLDKDGQLIVRAIIVTEPQRSLVLNEKCPKNSCIWHVFHHPPEGEVLRADVQKLKYYHSSDRQVRYEAAVTFAYNDRRIGVLNVERYKDDGPFSKDDGETLFELARFAAMATHIFEEQKSLVDLEARFLTEAKDLPTTLQEILNEAKNAHGFSAGLIYIADEARRRLDVRGWMGRPEHEFGYEFDDHAFVCGIHRNKAPDWVRDVKRSAATQVNRKGVNLFKIKGSMIGMPLMFRDACVGVLVCWSDGKAPRPGTYHRAHLQPLARLAAWKIGVFQIEQRQLETNRSQARQLEFFTSLVQHLPIRIFQKNVNHQFTFANQGFVEHLGKTDFESEVKNKTDFDFYIPKLAEQFQHDDDLVTASGLPRAINEPNQLLSGSNLVKVRGFKAPIVNSETGKVDGVQGMFWDLSMHDQLDGQKSAMLNAIGLMLKFVTEERKAQSEVEPLLAKLAEHLSGDKVVYELTPECTVVMAAMRKALAKKPHKLLDGVSNREIQAEIDWESVQIGKDPQKEKAQKQAHREWVRQQLTKLRDQFKCIYTDGVTSASKWYLVDKQ